MHHKGVAGPEEVRRHFWELLEDSIYLLEEAEDQDDGVLTGSLSRASVVASLMLLEAAANTCVEGLGLERSISDEVDRLPIVSKFEVFLRIRFRGRSLDRGSRPAQILRELKRVRDSYAHPKPDKVIWERWRDEEGGAAISDRTPVLDIAANPNHWQPIDAIAAMRGVHIFLSFFFRDLCRFRPSQVSSLLLSEEATPDLDFKVCPYLDGNSRQRLHRWQVDISYIRFGWM